MHIIIGESNAQELRNKYTLLELDMIKHDPNKPAHPAYCVLEDIPIPEIPDIDQFAELHGKLIENYRKRNWNYCEQALEHLMGRWGSQMNSFYTELTQRIDKYKEEDPGEDWDYSIHKY
jgi:hypothetical protein